MSVAVDPYAEVGADRRFLGGINPLAKLAGPFPAILLLVFVRDLTTPSVFLVLAYAVILAGTRLTRTVALILGVALPLGVVVFGVGMSVWIDASRIDRSVEIVSIGAWTLYSGALEIGFATSLRLAAIVALALIAGLTTTGPDVVRASVQQLRVPYRVGYTALAAFRFVPRFRHELDIIRQAHRVRGAHGGRFAVVARWWGYVVPLLAGAIRHAERVALAMDARAFGAHPDRTERHLVPFRARDVVFLGGCWVVSAVVFAALFPWTLG
ncbi:energy-coupling factor transporter transmembrane protein EcfT [Microbacterium saccharophilum]|uniref:Energy-coupling factor transporter transmembrane protein EcfT n=1 Tax=Microbacterium saccharophilum TaxID=1213358 RepID=A0A5C8I9W9_9MICO|nr:energy-coupling factor transporter transmembrane component T [Microbacterium saccharophilum]TXK15203.1 energy-coupling factor transporter transmembrane protein EcfT [Microbacterium saccharophilum]GEP49211.1 ABC transporter [Microbacterium saccharophilum]